MAETSQPWLKETDPDPGSPESSQRKESKETHTKTHK